MNGMNLPIAFSQWLAIGLISLALYSPLVLGMTEYEVCHAV